MAETAGELAIVDPAGGTLKFRMWVTRGCFFALCDRLKRKSRYSIGSITLLSFYVFMISMIALIYADNLPKSEEILLACVSIILSVLIIIVTLLENSKEYTLTAEFAFQTAHALENLYNRYEAFLEVGASANGGNGELSYREEYNQILRTARLTRKAIDYHLFQLQNAAAFKLSAAKYSLTLLILACECVFDYWIYATMALAPPLAFVTAIFVFSFRFGP